MTLKFEFRVVDGDGETIVSDWTTFDPAQIDLNGATEPVDMHTGSALRFIRRQHIAGKLERVSA